MPDNITMITIDKVKIGLIGLTSIIDEVKSMKLANENKIREVLLEMVKSQNYVPDIKQNEYANALLKYYKKCIGLPVEEDKETTGLTIRILGPGCYACDKLEQDIKAILAEINVAADVEHVRDLEEISQYGMVRSPGLVINEEVVLSGRSLPKSQLKKLLEEKLK